MSRKIKLFISVLAIIIFVMLVYMPKISASSAINAYDVERGLTVVGTYEKIERKEVEVELQITEEMKEYYDEHNLDYYTKTIDLKFWIFTIYTYEYYYIKTSYYDNVI